MARRRPYLVGIVVAILINSSRSWKVSLTAGVFSWLKRSSLGSVVEEAWGEFLEVLGLDCCCGVVVFLRPFQKLVFGGAGESKTVATFFGVTLLSFFSGLVYFWGSWGTPGNLLDVRPGTGSIWLYLLEALHNLWLGVHLRT
ncbi:hypothetical protein TNCT_419181 [Trichonephila clavata]|uniref:Uncharacterized protein n=1 Tax=Trichonephila clavata TaxID=2740835 RepID=A0A8X6H6J9_TRICU|nr:hypothetical protein TNCT_419181 [Trichonephila clavata]